MNYRIADLAGKPNEFVFLEGWVNPETNHRYFELGERGTWFRCSHQGYKFAGKTQTVCVYPPPYGRFHGLSYSNAKKIAIAYVTGKFVKIDIDLRDRS